MISSASTLLLATLVFNAASVFGAPLRIPDTVSEVVARAELSTPVQPVARADVVDVEDHRRRSQIGTVSRRAARLVMERDEPFSEVVAAREPETPVEQKREEELRQRRYPRRILHDFYEKREPEPEPQPAVVEEPVARALRYPRRILHDLYEKREPATSVKETTLITTKVTVHDTPADAAAFAMGQAAGANAANVGASASTLSISIPLPSIPAVLNANAASGASTIVSISQTTTIASPDASATASSAAVATGTASASASAVTAAPTESASSSASAASVSASSTASSTATSSAAAPEATGTTGGDKAAGGDKKAGDDKAAAAATPAAAAAGSGEPTVDGTTSVPASNESRRWVKASTAPVARRMAVSGASWASAVRRQLTSITSDSE